MIDRHLSLDIVLWLIRVPLELRAAFADYSNEFFGMSPMVVRAVICKQHVLERRRVKEKLDKIGRFCHGDICFCGRQRRLAIVGES